MCLSTKRKSRGLYGTSIGPLPIPCRDEDASYAKMAQVKPIGTDGAHPEKAPSEHVRVLQQNLQQQQQVRATSLPCTPACPEVTSIFDRQTPYAWRVMFAARSGSVKRECTLARGAGPLL